MRVKELGHYGIQTVYVDSYPEVTELLRELEQAVKRNNVFISGSADDYGSWNCDDAEQLAEKMAAGLVSENFKVVSGFGLGIGSSVLNGALKEIYADKYKRMEKSLCLRPFPQGIKDPAEREDRFKKYRTDMISETGIVIFMFGNKKDPKDASKIINAPGCMQEYEIAREKGTIIIPIGSTGYVAEHILNEMKKDSALYSYLKGYWDVLEKEKDVDKLVAAVLEVVKKCRS